MIKKFTYEHKSAGDPITETDWNTLALDVDAAVDAINNLPNNSGNSTGNIKLGGTEDNSHMYLNTKGNLCIETTAENVPSGKKGKINIESKDDILIKPGDDVVLGSHHRAAGNRDLLLIKVLTDATGSENNEVVDDKEISAKLKINCGDITISNADTVHAIMVEINKNYNKDKQDYNVDQDFAANTFTNGTIYELSLIQEKLTGKNYTVNNIVDTPTIVDSNVIDAIANTSVGKNKKIKVIGTTTCYTFTTVSLSNGVTNINFEDSTGYGYLKLRAQSIDLRCEEHGGIALQPKGFDSDSNMNKIKFEHGGGDGLEFGTFNTEKTSIFTDEYRFNKDGVWKMATRIKKVSDKYNESDETTHFNYQKQQDDFYDVINSSDETATTEDIIKAANSLFNGTISQKLYTTSVLIDTLPVSDPNSSVDIYPTVDSNESLVEIPNADWQYIQSIVTPVLLKDFVASLDEAAGDSNYTMSRTNSILKTVEKVINRGEHITVWDSTTRKYAYITVTPLTVSCNISDIISLVNYMKTNNEGPWANV